MKSAAVKLEAFGVAAPSAPSKSVADVESAYREGYQSGLKDGRDVSIDLLTSELARTREVIQQASSDRERIHNEALSSVGPALALIIDLLGPAGARDRLLDALQKELGRLLASDHPGTLRIRCSHDLRPDIERCVAAAGLQAEFAEGGNAPGVEIDIKGGTIKFDPMRPAAELRNIIDELRIKD